MRSVRDIEIIAWKLRKIVLEMLYEAGSGHTASSLGLAEFFAVMYGSVLRYDIENPDWEERDRLIVSNGHVVPIWYAVLAEMGFFPKDELKSLRKLGSGLQGHSHWKSVPGIENTGGPLGQGVSVAAGRGLGLMLKRRESGFGFGYVPKVFCLLSDAELQEGQVWEAFQFSVAKDLKN